MDSSSQAEDVIGAGRGALICAMFGAGWLGWGLGNAKAFNGIVAPAFGFTALFLLAYSIYFIRKGRLLRKRSPAVAFPTTNSEMVFTRPADRSRGNCPRFDAGKSTPPRRPGDRLVCDGCRHTFSAARRDFSSSQFRGCRNSDGAVVCFLLGVLSFERDCYLSLGWDGNSAVGCLRLFVDPNSKTRTFAAWLRPARR